MSNTNETLLATFIGIQSCDCGCGGWKDKDNNLISILDVTSWDATMSIIDKIERMGYDVNISYSRINGYHYCKITDNADVLFVSSEENFKLQAVTDAIVEFVKWFNEKDNYHVS